MLRKEREILGFNEIVSVLKRCDTIRIGINAGDCPYVVPVSFGVCSDGGELRLYFHGAKRGYKAELLKDGASVCVEGDIFIKVEQTEQGITTRYESVIGRGTVSTVSGEERLEGLQSILEHYGFSEYPIGRCKGLAAAGVYKITLTQLTGKRNIDR